MWGMRLGCDGGAGYAEADGEGGEGGHGGADWVCADGVDAYVDGFDGGGKLYVATAKGKGTGPNSIPQRPTAATKGARMKRGFTYIGTLLYGSLAALDVAAMERSCRGGRPRCWSRTG